MPEINKRVVHKEVAVVQGETGEVPKVIVEEEVVEKQFVQKQFVLKNVELPDINERVVQREPEE